MKSSTSASASKKRKMSHADDENMEKFYALIKNIREARDRLITSAAAEPEIVQKDAADDRSETKKRKLEEYKENQEAVGALNPSFRREDFKDEADNKPKEPPMSFAGTSQSKAGSDHNDRKEELDLTLSL
ncbi:hypothetical protein V6N13_087119 [Hibiscus sabdariffa]|uniref:Uncharacterized protein n=1 Tax=Hibiscus sabdariffa TaxID=183260 RepID=A0ABR2FVK8_9ROSI